MIGCSHRGSATTLATTTFTSTADCSATRRSRLVFLFLAFLLLGRQAGSLDFDAFRTIPVLTEGLAGLIFVLALVGFGSKAGFVPFHVWLPEAHLSDAFPGFEIADAARLPRRAILLAGNKSSFEKLFEPGSRG